MNPSLASALLIILALLNGCGERQAQLDSPQSHASGSISFDYPRNWKVTEDAVTGEFHNLFVESPGDALAILQSFPLDGVGALLDRAKAFSVDAASEAPIGRVASSGFSALAERNGFERLKEEFTVTLLGESVPHQRVYATRVVGERRYYLIFQSPSEDLAKVEPGFDLILDSFKVTGGK